MPQFHGETRKFAEFRNVFETLVHNNPALSNYKKMAHLKSALKHDAEKILSDAAQNNVNYPEAWASVCQWFENKILFLNALFGDSFAICRIKYESQLRKLVMEVDLLLRRLKSVDQNIDTWGNWLYFFVSTKLNEETCREWMSSQTGIKEYPEWEDLKEFLLSKVHTTEAMSVQFKVTQTK